MTEAQYICVPKGSEIIYMFSTEEQRLYFRDSMCL